MTSFTKKETLEAAKALLEANGYTVTHDDIVTLTVDGVYDPRLVTEKAGIYRAMSQRMGAAIFEHVKWYEAPAGIEQIGKVRATARLTLVLSKNRVHKMAAGIDKQ